MTQVKARRLATQYTKFGSVRVLHDGGVRFSAWTVPGLPQLDFIADHWSMPMDDRPRYDPANYDISANLRGTPVFFLHLTRRRVESAGFAYNLSPAALRDAISVLRDAGNGIERWIVPALERNQVSNSMKQTNPETHRLVPELLRSLRDLPVAAAWKRQRRATRKPARSQG